MLRYQLIKLSGVFDILAGNLDLLCRDGEVGDGDDGDDVGAADSGTTITTPVITRLMMGADWHTLTSRPLQVRSHHR